jgi:hypothetical protein
MHSLIKIKKDRVSLDVTGKTLTLGFNSFRIGVNMNIPSSLDIIDNNICVSFENQTYSFAGLNLKEIEISPTPVKQEPPKIVKKQKPTLNAKRYCLDVERLHPLTASVLLACSKENLSRTEIFQKILDKKNYEKFLNLEKYRRSYDYYRPLLWALEKEGMLACDYTAGRQAKQHRFATTQKGMDFLLQIRSK